MHVRTEPYLDILETARKLLLKDCTVTRYGRPLTATDGFIVGGACAGLVFPAFAEPEDAPKQVALWIQAQPSSVVLFGSWYDGAERLYIDGCTFIPDHTDAIRLGIERGERAIFDIAAQTCINLTDNAARGTLTDVVRS